MLETDCPVVYRGGTEFAHRSEPADMVRVLENVVRLKDIEPNMVASLTIGNAQKFFNLTQE